MSSLAKSSLIYLSELLAVHIFALMSWVYLTSSGRDFRETLRAVAQNGDCEALRAKLLEPVDAPAELLNTAYTILVIFAVCLGLGILQFQAKQLIKKVLQEPKEA